MTTGTIDTDDRVRRDDEVLGDDLLILIEAFRRPDLHLRDPAFAPHKAGAVAGETDASHA